MQQDPIQPSLQPAPQLAVAPPVPPPLVPAVRPVPVPASAGRHFLAVFFFSFVWGVFGADRFYLGKIWTGVLKLLTFGGFGIWVVTDLSQIMSGAMRDKQDRPMLEYDRYKKFARRTVMIFSIIVAAMLVATGISLYFAISNIVNQYLQGGSGGLNNLVPGGTQIPGLNQLMNL